jgi:tyrosyl-tRNA synthetase
MLAGTELIRKKTGDDAYAMTITLLMNSEGKKMGKTAKGAVWLDPEKTSPFEFYQYWRNVDDADVMKCIKMLTFLPMDKIAEMENWEDSRINEKKEILAYELTKLVHGEEEANKVLEAARSLFAGNGSDENMPSVELDNMEYTIVDLLVASELCASKSEARRLVEQGGVSVDGEKASNPNEMISLSEPRKVKKGKKVFLKVSHK